MNNEEYIAQEVPEASLYEGMAEECTELAQACLKMARVIRQENYTPVTAEDAELRVIEELADVLNYAKVLRLPAGTKNEKLARWVIRIKNNRAGV